MTTPSTTTKHLIHAETGVQGSRDESMTRYHLVKLVALAGTLSSRKRIQRIVYLLQTAGCPFEAEYALHLYGPYSPHVASLLNELVRQNLFTETGAPNGAGEQYSYSLSDTGRANFGAYEQTPPGQAEAAALQPFEARFRRLLAVDLWELGLAATVAFFWKRRSDRHQAVEQTALFKKVPANSIPLRKACRLAQSIIQPMG